MSYEIWIFLNVIVGFFNFIVGGIVDLDIEEVRDYLVLISKNCNYLFILVLDVFDFLCIEFDMMIFKFIVYLFIWFLIEIY